MNAPHRLLTVVRVIESAEADSITRKIETKAQFLAMKPSGFACVRCYCVKKSIQTILE